MEEHKRLQGQIEKREAMLSKILNGLQVSIEFIQMYVYFLHD